MEKDDGAGLDLPGHPFRDLGGGQIFPVQAVHVPLDGLHADGTDGGNNVIVIFPIGRADQGGAHTGDCLDFVVARLHVGNDLILGELRHMGVGIGVVHDLMSGVVEGLDGFWIFVHPLPHHKKGGFNLILAQDVDEHLGVLIPPGGVKRDGEDLLVPLDAVDGKLAGGGGGSDNGGVIDHIEHAGGQQQTDRGRQYLSFDQKHLHGGHSSF